LILKKLELQNIRSYKEEVIVFSVGKTLFQGDIGSGKSTILMAIEFALFGLGDLNADALLKTHETEGRVKLTFEVEEQEYTIVRGLIKKNNSVSQIRGILITPIEEQELNPSDLKAKILDILKFNESNSANANSVIYRYAIFTPQEQMNEILDDKKKKSDERFQTLRKAFGIEDYTIAINNADVMSKRLKNDSTWFRHKSEDLSEYERKLVQYDDDKKEYKKQLKNIIDRINVNDMNYTSLSEQKSGLELKEKELIAIDAKIESLNQRIIDKRNSNKILENSITNTNTRIINLENKNTEKCENPSEKTVDAINYEIKDFENHKTDLNDKISALNEKINVYKNTLSTGVCSICDQKANSIEFNQKISQKNKDKESKSVERDKHEKKLDDLKELLDKKQKYNIWKDKSDDNKKTLDSDNLVLIKLKNQYSDTEQSIDSLSKDLESEKLKQDKLSDISNRLKNILSHLSTSQNIKDNLSNEKTKIETQIENTETDIHDCQILVTEKKEQKQNYEILKESELWLKDYFIPCVSDIEKQRMSDINDEFNSEFISWFNKLVDDTGKNARIDEEFTPIISQDGEEQKINNLSGGEKTSTALAYRLALNNIVKKLSIGMKSNLLILDEPTDGFSKEQLIKVIDILKQIECEQMIIVSHERDLTSLSDYIFKVTKTSSSSKIEKLHNS